MAISLTFGALEGALAKRHFIANDKRTQFQGRLRKFQRLGIGAVPSGRGVAGRYGVPQIIETALALEFTELGVLPERLRRILRSNDSVIAVALRMAALSLLKYPEIDPLEDRDEHLTHMFLFFDPNALRPLTRQEEEDFDWAAATLYRNGAADLRAKLVAITLQSSRLALINCTAMLGRLAAMFDEKGRADFLQEAVSWSEELEAGVEWGEGYTADELRQLAVADAVRIARDPQDAEAVAAAAKALPESIAIALIDRPKEAMPPFRDLFHAISADIFEYRNDALVVTKFGLAVAAYLFGQGGDDGDGN